MIVLKTTYRYNLADPLQAEGIPCTCRPLQWAWHTGSITGPSIGRLFALWKFGWRTRRSARIRIVACEHEGGVRGYGLRSRCQELLGLVRFYDVTVIEQH
jgi:hypothetical protein